MENKETKQTLLHQLCVHLYGYDGVEYIYRSPLFKAEKDIVPYFKGHKHAVLDIADCLFRGDKRMVAHYGMKLPSDCTDDTKVQPLVNDILQWLEQGEFKELVVDGMPIAGTEYDCPLLIEDVT